VISNECGIKDRRKSGHSDALGNREEKKGSVASEFQSSSSSKGPNLVRIIVCARPGLHLVAIRHDAAV